MKTGEVVSGMNFSAPLYQHPTGLAPMAVRTRFDNPGLALKDN
jgi:hypothetical protein